MANVRLLICHSCRTIEELPDYQGPAEYDVILDHAVEAHRFADGREHLGKLAAVDETAWRDPGRRNAILDKIREATKSTGLPGEFYATKNTYQEDALRCYGRHHRPKEGCIDYCDSDKRIGNPTKAGWQAGPRVFICQFCPVETWVQTQVRHQKGLYKDA